MSADGIAYVHGWLAVWLIRGRESKTAAAGPYYDGFIVESIVNVSSDPTGVN